MFQYCMDLNLFQHKQTLSVNRTEKRAILLCTVKEQEGEAIVILTSKVPEFNSGSFEHIETIFTNDIYASYHAQVSAEYEIQTIYPITPKHLDKYTPKAKILVEETAASYQQTRQ